MKLEDQEMSIVVDDAFPCSSAGEMRVLEPGVYEVGFKPEELPQWFQAALDELFAGRGVPKEYMAHVRVANTGNVPRTVKLHFLLSDRGSGYMFPPWWVRRADGGWAWVPPEDTVWDDGKSIDISVEVQPGESLRIASAPYEEPEAVCEKARRLAERSKIWTYREIGTSAQGRSLPVLETEPRELKILVDATMQSCEPVSWGVMHVAHWLTIPTARTQRLLDRVQFCLLPMMNPDGVVEGRSVTNAVGEVPKFGINDLVEGGTGPRETEALWKYMMEVRPDIQIEVHAHFTRDDFMRSVGMHFKESMPESLQAKAGIIEAAIFENYHAEPLKNRKVLIDPRQPEHNVYGDRHVSERVGAIRTFLQAVPDSIESHCADVREFTETLACALIQWKDQT